jgi:hypothetical protein
VRQDAVAARMAREEEDLPSREPAAEDHIRRRAEWRLNVVLRDVREAINLVEAAAADDSDVCWF